MGYIKDIPIWQSIFYVYFLNVEYVILPMNIKKYDTKPVTVPCALCLQVLSEFAAPSTPIHLGDLESVKKTVLFGDLLPMPFNTLDC